MPFIDNFLDQHKNRIIGLDIVRSVAILLVIYLHGSFLIPDTYENLKKLFYFPLPFIDGVSIFFVLSGFLIGGILFKVIETTAFTCKDLFNFWLRRWLRTLPNYFFVLGIVLLFQFLLTGNTGDFNWRFLFFSQNLTSPHPIFFREAWSLSVEEWFYLLFPVLCFAFFKIFRSKKNAILTSALILFIFPLLLRSAAFVDGRGLENLDEYYRKIVLFRLDSLMFGVIGAYFFRYKNQLWKKHKTNCLLVSMMLIGGLTLYAKLNYSDPVFLGVYLFSLESLAALLMLPFFSELKEVRGKYITFFFTFISVISYSMYLLNFSVIQLNILPLLIDTLKLNDSANSLSFILEYCLYWIFVIVFSFLLHRYVEKPVMDLRDKLRLN